MTNLSLRNNPIWYLALVLTGGSKGTSCGHVYRELFLSQNISVVSPLYLES